MSSGLDVIVRLRVPAAAGVNSVMCGRDGDPGAKQG